MAEIESPIQLIREGPFVCEEDGHDLDGKPGSKWIGLKTGSGSV
jgi:hypothetical protein